MGEKTQSMDGIISELRLRRGFDFSGYRKSMLERRIQKRIDNTQTNNTSRYLDFLRNNENEWEKLVDVLTINVSQFFRDRLPFELFEKKLLPEYLYQNTKKPHISFRVWSAGCATGEEPYTMAILLNEWFEQNKAVIPLTIFATDIDKNSLRKAKEGVYNLHQIEQTRFGLVSKYFTQESGNFKIRSDVKKQVNFSFFDLLSSQNYSPPESIYGAFDLVLCRNVLIYYNKEYQKIIFNKLYKSLNLNGYLILGESESIIDEFEPLFKRENSLVKIFKKIK